MNTHTQPTPTRHTQTQPQTRDKEIIVRVRMSRGLVARLTAYAKRRGWRHGDGWNVSRAVRETTQRGMGEEAEVDNAWMPD